MTPADERPRLAAHVLLDMVSVQDFNTTATAATQEATRTAFARLNDVEQVTTIDSTALMSACGSLTVLLMDQVQKQGYEREGVIVALRETIDELFGA